MRSILFILAAAVVLAVVGFRVRHRRCTVCGVQEYERSVFGVAVEPLCEREYDEWGSYAEWRRRNGGACAHTFVTAPAATSPR